jgi:hypothetical protein
MDRRPLGTHTCPCSRRGGRRHSQEQHCDSVCDTVIEAFGELVDLGITAYSLDAVVPSRIAFFGTVRVSCVELAGRNNLSASWSTCTQRLLCQIRHDLLISYSHFRPYRSLGDPTVTCRPGQSHRGRVHGDSRGVALPSLGVFAVASTQ